MSHRLVLNGAPGYQEKHRAAYNYEEQPVQWYGTAGQHVPSLAGPSAKPRIATMGMMARLEMRISPLIPRPSVPSMFQKKGGMVLLSVLGLVIVDVDRYLIPTLCAHTSACLTTWRPARLRASRLRATTRSHHHSGCGKVHNLTLFFNHNPTHGFYTGSQHTPTLQPPARVVY